MQNSNNLHRVPCYYKRKNANDGFLKNLNYDGQNSIDHFVI